MGSSELQLRSNMHGPWCLCIDHRSHSAAQRAHIPFRFACPTNDLARATAFGRHALKAPALNNPRGAFAPQGKVRRTFIHIMCNLNALIDRRTAIEQQLAERGFRIESSLSSLDSEVDQDALFSLESGDLVDPPDEQTAMLMLEWSGICSEISAASTKMLTFQVTVRETYTNTFVVKAVDSDHAIEVAEGMAVERSFPVDHVETCHRTIAIAEGA